jgi:hypothetical protein
LRVRLTLSKLSIKRGISKRIRMWNKISSEDNIADLTSIGSYLRFIGDSGDLIGDIIETFIIINKVGEKVKLLNINNGSEKEKECNQLVYGSWYVYTE